MATRKLLIAWHSRTGASEALARAAAQGAGDGCLLKAAEEVERSKLPFLLFKSKENKGVNIIYRREDGNMGWIEPR